MELPDIITRLPEAELPFPSTTVKTSVLQSERLFRLPRQGAPRDN
jgi:hypothetical protein